MLQCPPNRSIRTIGARHGSRKRTEVQRHRVRGPRSASTRSRRRPGSTRCRSRARCPAWLTGSLLRTGPAKFEDGEQPDAPLVRRPRDAPPLRLRRRRGLLRQPLPRQQGLRGRRRETGEITYSEFATDPCRSLFKRAFTMFMPKLTDNANVNLVKLGERFVAMTETPIPVQFDPETLDGRRRRLEGPRRADHGAPAPRPRHRRVLNYAAKLGPRNKYRFFLVAPDGRDPERLASMPVDEPAYMHSFGLTERWIVLAEFPFVVNPLRLATSRPPLHRELPLEARARHPLHADRPRRRARRSGPFETDACFGFHHVNAYEDARRRGRRRHLHVPGRRDRRGPLPRPAARRQAGRRSRSCTGSRSTRPPGP